MPTVVATPVLRIVGCSIMVTPLTGSISQAGHSGDDLAADCFQRRDLVYVRDEADHRLYSHPREPAQLIDQPVYFLAPLANVEAKSAGLLYGFVVSTFFLAMPA